MGAGDVCGAVAGGVLAIGLVYGKDYPDAIGVLTEEYMTQIEERVGTVHCKEIIGTDISGDMNAEDFKSIARILWVFFIQGKRKTCNGVVKSAVQVILEQRQEWEA
jgi:hypothetical protein